MKQGRSTAAMTKTAEFCWSRVERGGPHECWKWTGPLNTWGYGDCTWTGRRVNASRAAFESAVGPVPEGLVVCHKCDEPSCCNPAHLFAATQAENLADCRRKGRQVYRSGVSHHRATAKLTAERVAEAKRLFAEGVSQSEIARRWGMSSGAICRAVRGKTWRHVE